MNPHFFDGVDETRDYKGGSLSTLQMVAENALLSGNPRFTVFGIRTMDGDLLLSLIRFTSSKAVEFGYLTEKERNAQITDLLHNIR